MNGRALLGGLADEDSAVRLRGTAPRLDHGAVICDETPVFRAGMRALVREAGIAVVGEAGSAQEARAEIERTSPDLVVVDAALIERPEAWLRIVRRTARGVRVLVLARHHDADLAREFLSAGLEGYALRDDPPDALLEAMRDVLVGARYVSQRLPRSLADDQTRGPRVPSIASLSSREREVLELFVRGYSNEHVARELGLSVKTVQTHRARINRKLCVHSAAELVRFAALRGLVRP